METSEMQSIFTIDDDLMNQWFDSFDPSIKTFTIDFVINKLRRFDFNPDAIDDWDDKLLARLLLNQFGAFLHLKMMEANPGRVITSWEVLPPS